MKDKVIAELVESAEVRRLVAEQLGEAIVAAAEVLLGCYIAGGKVLFSRNAGSATDCQHLATELVARCRRERRGLPAMALTTDTSLLTAIANDYSYDRVFARQVEVPGRPKDALVSISTVSEVRA